MEQEGVLEHHADLLSQRFQRQTPDVMAVDPHRADLRSVQAGEQQGGKRDYRAQGSAAGDHKVAAEKPEDGGAGGPQYPHQHEEPASDHGLPDVEAAQLVIEALEARVLARLGDERLYQQDAGDAEHLRHESGHLGEFALSLLAGAEGGLAHPEGGKDKRRQHQEGDDGHLTAEGDHQDQGAGQDHDIAHQAEDGVRDHALDAVYVVAQAGHHVSGSGPGEERDRLPDHAVEQLVAQVVHDALADPGADVRLQHAYQSADQRGRHQDADQQADERELSAAPGQVVDQGLGHQRRHQAEG